MSPNGDAVLCGRIIQMILWLVILSIILFAVLTIALRLNFTFNYETGGDTVFDAGVSFG